MNDHLYDAFDSELVIVGGNTVEALVSEMRRLIAFLEQAPSAQLEDVAFTCVTAAMGKKCVVSIVADSTAELLSRLRVAASRVEGGIARIRDKSGTYYFREHLAGPGTNGKVAFLFPGGMSFYPDMLRDLLILFPVCRLPFDELEEAMAGSPVAKASGFSPSAFVFPPTLCYRHDADAFSAGGYAQCIVSSFAANQALYNLVRALGVRPDGVFGFSGGDLSALAVAGAFGEFKSPARVKFLREYYALVDRAVDRAGLPKCVLVSVISPRPGSLASALAEYTADQAAVAFNQSQRQHTVALAPEIAEDAIRGFSDAGIKALKLPVDRPFNTRWCAKIIPELRKFGKAWVDFKLSMPLYSCATARPLMASKARHIRDEVAEGWASEIKFEETVLRMAEDGYRIFLEVGPRGSMCGTIDDILRGRGCAAVATNRIHRSGLTQLHHALGALAALGVQIDASFLHARRRRRLLDFDSPLTLEIKADAEMRLESKLPQLVLFSNDTPLASAAPRGTPRQNKAAQRAAAIEARNRRQRQFDLGSSVPLISDAVVVDETPGITREITTTLRLSEYPFLSDYAYGTTQLSYTDDKLRGFLPLPLTAGAEMMAELAQELVPSRHVVRIDDLVCRHQIAFAGGALKVYLRAERVASPDPSFAAVKVQLRGDSKNSAYTWPAMEGTFLLAEAPLAQCPYVPEELERQRNVHWESRDIYPDRLHYGPSLQLVESADLWSEAGLNYEIRAPERDTAVAHTRVPTFVVDPMLFEGVFSGFPLWRTHEKFGANFCVLFRLKRLELHVASFVEEHRFNCYMRLRSFTPKSLIGDIAVTDGNGNLLANVLGLEQMTERVPPAYRQLILSPAVTFLTEELSPEVLGAKQTPVSGVIVSDVPYPMFERNEEFWLRVLSEIVLGKSERREFAQKTGSAGRRTEWLFGRIAAKEATRRFLHKYYQARWSDADVQIWPDDSGKPRAIGEWSSFVSAKLDLTIAHTSRLVIAAVAPSSRIGIDIESIGRTLSNDFTRGVFDDTVENCLADSMPGSSYPHLRFWCAKEAVSKALGTGIRYSPKEMLVVSCVPETGDIEVQLTGQWLDAFKQFTGRTIPVHTAIVRDHVLASCILPESLFGEEEATDFNKELNDGR